jgi:hypothetical protein
MGEMILVPVSPPTFEAAHTEYYYDEQADQYLLTDTGYNIILAAVDALENLSAGAATTLGAVPNEVVTVVKQQLRELGLEDVGYGPLSQSGDSDGEDSGEGGCSDTSSP